MNTVSVEELIAAVRTATNPNVAPEERQAASDTIGVLAGSLALAQTNLQIRLDQAHARLDALDKAFGFVVKSRTDLVNQLCGILDRAGHSTREQLWQAFDAALDPHKTPTLLPELALLPDPVPAKCCGCTCGQCRHQGGEDNHTLECGQGVYGSEEFP